MKKVAVIVLIAVLLTSGVMIMAHAQRTDDADMAQKLDTIIENQNTIMSDMAAIKQELQIIKIRITQAQ